MNNPLEGVVKQLATQIGNMSIQLAAANARIEELEQERVKDNGTSEKHDQLNSAKGSSRTANDDTNAGKTSPIR